MLNLDLFLKPTASYKAEFITDDRKTKIVVYFRSTYVIDFNITKDNYDKIFQNINFNILEIEIFKHENISNKNENYVNKVTSKNQLPNIDELKMENPIGLANSFPKELEEKIKHKMKNTVENMESYCCKCSLM